MIARRLVMGLMAGFLALPMVSFATVDAHAGQGAAQGPASTFIQQLTNRLGHFLTDKGLTAEQREAEFKTLFVEAVDVDRVSRFTLGKYYRQATANERSAFKTVFTDYMVKTYVSRFSQAEGFDGESLKVTSEVQKKRDTVVTMLVDNPGGGKPFKLDWRMRQNDGGEWKIIDVIIEGVSMLISQRNEFSAVIEQKGGKVQGLVEELTTKVAGLNGAAQ